MLNCTSSELILEGLVESLIPKLDTLSTQVQGLADQVSQLDKDVSELKDDLKGWTAWLRSATTIILFSVALTLIGLVLPIAISLWRQSLV